MKIKHLCVAILSSLLAANFLTACHTVNHVPPGQVKKIGNPPPGKGGIPPGQMKKY